MKSLIIGAVSLIALVGCSSHKHHGHKNHSNHEKRAAVANLITNVKGLAGKIEFFEENGVVTVKTHVEGLSTGAHGFHIHEIGDCSKLDFTSAGGHFNPDKVNHGSLHAEHAHAGDLGNLVAGKDERAFTTITTSGITLGEGKNSAIGKAVIIHEKADDFVTQPTGNAGGRIACGVIEKI